MSFPRSLTATGRSIAWNLLEGAGVPELDVLEQQLRAARTVGARRWLTSRPSGRAARRAESLLVDVRRPSPGSAVATSAVARESVVGDWLPGRGRIDPRPYGWTNAWVAVERAHANADPLGMPVVAREDRRATRAAEPFLATVVGLPAPQGLFAGEDAKRVDGGMGARRGGRARPALAATAVAIARAEKLACHLIPHRTAVAATSDRERRHGHMIARQRRRRDESAAECVRRRSSAHLRVGEIAPGVLVMRVARGPTAGCTGRAR